MRSDDERFLRQFYESLDERALSAPDMARVFRLTVEQARSRRHRRAFERLVRVLPRRLRPPRNGDVG